MSCFELSRRRHVWCIDGRTHSFEETSMTFVVFPPRPPRTDQAAGESEVSALDASLRDARTAMAALGESGLGGRLADARRNELEKLIDAFEQHLAALQTSWRE